MNYIILIGFIIAITKGWIDAGKKMKLARTDATIGVRPSKSLLSFLFLDY